jgi:sulfur relay (sulfurtransferase) complex TusBCD TusD component (DsrE family)
VQVLVVLNEPGQWRERTSTALDLAGCLVRNDDTRVRLYLAGASAVPIPAGQLARLVALGVEVRHQSPRPDIAEDGEPIVGVEVGTIRGLSEWTLEADRVLVF